jgi:Na+-transporting methylmalonyl-CoA/oxaloacetate decarboxylase gamma subunit
MEFLTLVIIIYALTLMGVLIANLVVGLNIQQSSKQAAEASTDLNDGLNVIKSDLHKLYEWIIEHLPHVDTDSVD